jgi:FkbM family methyltransferase
MRDIFVKSNSILHRIFPFLQKTRAWARKYDNRVGRRFVISGGKVQFMDMELNFPEKVGLLYATPLFWNGPEAYEGPTSRAIATLIRPARLFLDIGSNIGIYAIYAALKYPQMKVFAFEPIRSIWEKNVAFHRANGLPTENALHLAVSDAEGVQTIFLPIAPNGLEEEQTATLCTDSWQTREPKVESEEIQCVTIDAFAARHSLPDGFCVMKIDVENFEAGVFRGGAGFMRQRRPWIVCEMLPNQETDPVTGAKRNNNGAVLALIEELRYAIFAITEEGAFRMQPCDFVRPRNIKDFVLIPREKVPEEWSFLALSSLEELVDQAS